RQAKAFSFKWWIYFAMIAGYAQRAYNQRAHREPGLKPGPSADIYPRNACVTQAGLFSTDPIELMIRVPVVLLALTVHEFSHAYFALLMGDPTAYRLGRCSLDPLRHLDPLGPICLMFAPIGWLTPAPLNTLHV